MGDIIPLFTSEAQLVKACQQGNAKAQRRLYERYASKMLSICRRYLADDMEAEDVMVEGFVKIFDKIGEFRSEGSFEGWMKRLMVNEALMALRKKKAEGFAIGIDLAEGEVYDGMGSKLEAEDLMSMIAALPQGFRTVFNLYAIEGYNHAEIAELLGISEGTSKSQLSRARVVLQQKIRQTEKPMRQQFGEF